MKKVMITLEYEDDYNDEFFSEWCDKVFEFLQEYGSEIDIEEL